MLRHSRGPRRGPTHKPTGYPYVADPQWPQPFWIWPIAKPEFIDEEMPPIQRPTIHALRTTYQTVGQPRLNWWRPAERIEDDREVPEHWQPNIHALRGGFQTVGQPFFMRTQAVAEPAPEQDEVRIDYSVMFFSRSTPAVIPPGGDSEWIIRARRRKGR